MSEVRRLVTLAVIYYLDGNYILYRYYMGKAMEAQRAESIRNMLHASIGEIINYKHGRTNYEQIN